MKKSTKSLVLCGVFTSLMCISAYIRFPVPPVPVTLQLEVSVLSGIILGKKYGLISVASYIVLGIFGVPVFAGGSGIGYVISPSFGYIIGFAVSAYVSGVIASKKNPTRLRFVIASLCGMLSVYTVALPWYYVSTTYYVGSVIKVSSILTSCFAVFLPADTLLCVISAFAAFRIKQNM